MGQTIISPEAKGRELKRDDITCKITYCAVGKDIYINKTVVVITYLKTIILLIAYIFYR